MAKKLVRVIAKLTAEELHFAAIAANAAYSGRMPMEPVSERAAPIEIEGHGFVRLTDIPFNRASMAIMDCFPEDETKRQAALFRILMIMFDVMNDERARVFMRDGGEPGVSMVHPALLEAIATVPAHFSSKPPIDRVFTLATKISKTMDDQ